MEKKNAKMRAKERNNQEGESKEQNTKETVKLNTEKTKNASKGNIFVEIW
jgi:hypothetical protein